VVVSCAVERKRLTLANATRPLDHAEQAIHLAASTSEADVARALEALLVQDTPFD
jgi:hypothetical protein